MKCGKNVTDATVLRLKWVQIDFWHLTIGGKQKSEQSWGSLYVLHIWDAAIPRECPIRMNMCLTWPLVWTCCCDCCCCGCWAIMVGAIFWPVFWELIDCWTKNEKRMRNISGNSLLWLKDPATLVLTDLAADGWPSLWGHLHGGDRLATWCTPVTLNLHLWSWEGQRNALNPPC